MTGNPAQPAEKLSTFAIRLIRRLLTIVDADFTEVSIQDREWLEQALLGTDLNIIARHQKLTRERIRQRINAALDLLYQKVEAWEDSQTLRERVKQLEEEAAVRERQLAETSRSASMFEAENQHLRSLLNEYAAHYEFRKEITLVDEKTKQILHKSLRQLGLPPNVYTKFTANNIHSVLELIRYNDLQLCCMDGVTDYAVEMAKRALRHHGLHLGSDIRWSPEKNEYYIYPNDIK